VARAEKGDVVTVAPAVARASRAGAAWARHAREWREPEQAATLWRAAALDPALLRHRVYGDWWDLLRERKITLVVTREYEHLVVAMTANRTGPIVTFLPLPHPSGLAIDRASGATFVATTRNPNQVFELRPAVASLRRLDVPSAAPVGRPLMPVASRFYPGCFYLHDLAIIGGALHANAVGQNAIVRLAADGAHTVWWPRAVERRGSPVLGRNHIQLNSIAAGATIEQSYFSASGAALGRRRPGDPLYPVDGRGVIFSGATREPLTRGLTRPHSARLHRGRLWVANSGYGELCEADRTGPGYRVGARAPGWTRGLSFHDDLAFVGTSRVIPRFSRYAPGLNPRTSVCGVHAVDLRSGTLVAGVTWPSGNQIFAVDWMDRHMSSGLPFGGGRPHQTRSPLFYAYETAGGKPSEDE
jgi:uncharacterized protein (TIGR03032 family)